LGCAGAIDTASTSASSVNKGRTDVSTGQPSTDDHVSEVWLTATCRQTHPVGHFCVGLVTGTTTVRTALTNLNWCRAMEKEFIVLIANNTWDLVWHPVGSNIFVGKFIFKHKFN
jgi:hypothetical protein